MDKLLDLIVRSWKPEQALLVYDFLSSLEQAVWDAHESGILDILIQREERSASDPPTEDSNDPFPFGPPPE